MMMIGRQSEPSAPEVGAVAIITAICAVILFGAAALGVELSDMFSRSRAVQTTADLAAFAGAQKLPDTCAAFDLALSTLNDPGNGVRTDNGTTAFNANAADMKDGDKTNGEIEVLGPTGARVSACNTTGRIVRVTTPPRDVKFAFGAAIKGASSGDVQGVGAVELRGLDVSVLPLSLPSNCPSGPNYLYVDNGGVSGGPSEAGPAYTPVGGNNGPHIASVTPNIADFPTSITVVANNLKDDPTASAVIFDFHLLRTDGTTTRQPTPSPAGIVGVVTPGTVSQLSSNNWQATFIVAVPSAVTATPGSWRVRGLQAAGFNKWTPDDSVGTVTIGFPSTPGCPNPTSGDFGLLNSPRSDGGSAQQQRFRNFAQGIDHNLMQVAAPTTDVPCASDGNPYVDGFLDDAPPRDDASCIDVKPGETDSLPTDGIVDGRGGEPGRFAGSPPVSPGSHPGANCTVAGDSDLSWQSKSGKTLVDTVLSCYLASGKSLSDVLAGTPDSLTANIADDPRFFYVPVTDTTIRPPNSSGGAQFWPIKSFRGAFATNEKTAGDATCASLTDCNGLIFNNGGTQLKAIQAFSFPLSALPSQVDQPGNGGDFHGGTKDFLLIQ